MTICITFKARFSLFAQILPLICLLFAPGSAEGKDGKAIQLSYWSSANPEEVALARDLSKEWNLAHPHIQIKTQPIPAGNSTEEVLLASMVAKSTPDICSNILPLVVNRFLKAKAVLALDSFKDFKTVAEERLAPKTLEMFRSPDGHYYQMPWKSNPVMLAYNLDLFKRLQLQAPRTYSDFEKIARKLTRDTDGDGRVDQWAMNPSTLAIWWQRLFDFMPFYFASSSGKPFLKKGVAAFDNPHGVGALSFFENGFKKGYFPKTGAVMDLFIHQKAAMAVVGPWAIKYYSRAASSDFQFDFVPIPVPDDHKGPSFTYGDPKNIVIFSTTRHPKEAWEFLKFLISRTSDLKLLEKTFQIPLRKNIVDDSFYQEFFAGNPMIRKFGIQAESIGNVGSSRHFVQIMDHLAQQYEASAVYGVIPPQKAIENISKFIENLNRNW